MNRFPAYIDLRGHSVLIIGGGEAALGKACLMIEADADVAVIWPDHEKGLIDELQERASLEAREPVDSDFDGARLVFIALEDAEVTAHWAEIARQAGALVNAVDAPALCDFNTPSIIDRGRLTVAISTDGASPVYGRRLRAKIEAMLPERADALLDFANSYRPAVKGKLSWTKRRGFWEDFFNGPIAAQILAGDGVNVHEAMITAINSVEAGDHSSQKTGIVHIVGAGPGDPELLTLKAFRLIQSADVILHDRLVSDEVLALSRRDAERFYVGKQKANHAVPQEEIEARMIALAREGKIVVRLKGGDPFVFGRGGEELDALRAAGVPTFVTPGITAATGCAASAGMTLTHRDFSQAVTFVTGHAKGEGEPDLDWASLAALKNTLVVYMGVGTAGSIASKLIDNGRAPTTPVAVIENGTRKNEILLKGSLGELTALIEAGGITGPALLVIGEVASLADGNTIRNLAQHAPSSQERHVA